ncbi:FG-GAP-like repeat-containing protein [Luminiphilus sp.]|nr:FG-GAP-like repeat-containing protein [Luminiphilus sp.]
MTVLTNIAAMKATHAMAKSHARVEASMANLSTGSRINSAKDDAAGLAVSVKMSTRTLSIARGQANAIDAVSMLATADEVVAKLIELVQGGRELNLQAANGTQSSADKTYLSAELKALQTEFARICESTEFNGERVFGDDPSSNRIVKFIVGADTTDTIEVDFSSVFGQLFAQALVPEISATRSPYTFGTQWEESWGIDFTDINNDGIGDIISKSKDSQGTKVKFFFGDGNGNFIPNSSSRNAYDMLVDTSQMGLASIDINNDGYEDLIMTHEASVNYYLNDGAGAYIYSSGNRGPEVEGVATGTRYNKYIAAGDANNDGKEDIVLTDYYGTVQLYTNDGDGTFTLSWQTSDANPLAERGNELFDVDGDGDLDLIRLGRETALESTINGYPEAWIEYHENLGDGTFSASPYGYLVQGIAANAWLWTPNDLAVGDINADGKDDLLYSDGLNLYSHLNEGTLGSANISSSPAAFDSLIEDLLAMRVTYGANINRLGHTIDRLTTTQLNLQASISKISDTNYATEVSNLASEQIIHKASSAMLAQANASQEVVFALLKEWL